MSEDTKTTGPAARLLGIKALGEKVGTHGITDERVVAAWHADGRPPKPALRMWKTRSGQKFAWQTSTQAGVTLESGTAETEEKALRAAEKSLGQEVG